MGYFITRGSFESGKMSLMINHDDRTGNRTVSLARCANGVSWRLVRDGYGVGFVQGESRAFWLERWARGDTVL